VTAARALPFIGGLSILWLLEDLTMSARVISGGFKLYAHGPDWSTDAALQKLATTNLIIFHGYADLNVSYREQKPIHERLKQLNPNVEIVIAKGVGHQEAPEWKEKIVEYLSKVTA
jgi:predicted esterase